MIAGEPPPFEIRQLGQEVHVWAVHLRGSDELVERCLTALSEQELQRAERFRFQHLRRAFILRHGCVRILLAQYIAISWPDVQLECKSHGKPYVAAPRTDLCFNQSDSENLAVFAFAAGCEVGVDVEAVRPMTDMENLAAHFFSSEEVVDLHSIPPECRQTAFFAAWTRKEAYIKAVGRGLHCPLDSFRVTLLPGEEARLVHIEGKRQTTDSWGMHSFIPAEGYLGALAYPGRSRNVRLFPAMEASDLLACKTGRIPSGSLVY